MMKKTYKPNPIPPFETLEEEAKFWDTHDTSLLGKVSLNKLPILEKEKQEALTVRLQKSVKLRLERIARQKGIGPTTLVRMWLVEKLQSMSV